ncbi:MAG: 4'-phosphopantetheinyl transferase superfamily protein [Chitinophagaceae bacterium]
MQEKTKEIISAFLKIPADQINPHTVIDRSAVNSSILLHRMYARLAAEGLPVNDYLEVKTFGDLVQRQAGNMDNTPSAVSAVLPAGAIVYNDSPGMSAGSAGVGIDIEMVSAMPLTNDFREDSFYTMHFAVAEMAYCILQPDPYASFAGLFAAKEAIVKADNAFKKTEFKQIVVQHLSGGKPFYPGFNLSISHTAEMAVAVAMPVQQSYAAPSLKELPATGPGKPPAVPVGAWVLILTSLLLSIIALFLIAGKNG